MPGPGVWPMFEANEGDFAYGIRRRNSTTGGTSWHWEIRHRGTALVARAGYSVRSHDAAKTAALEAIFLASAFRRRGSAAPPPNLSGRHARQRWMSS
jgi:hypothetical protein